MINSVVDSEKDEGFDACVDPNIGKDSKLILKNCKNM